MAKAAFNEWREDKAQRLGASLTFYTLMSLAPLGVVIVAVAAAILGREIAEGQLAEQLTNFLGPSGARTVENIVQHAQRPGAGILASVLGVIALLWSASSAVVELQDALDTIWHAKTPSTSSGLFRSLISLLKDRFEAAMVVIGAGVVLILSVTIGAVIAATAQFFDSVLPIPGMALQAATIGVTFLLVMVVFAAIYKLLPHVQLEWSDVWVGAAITAVLFSVGRILIQLYLSKVSFASAYGAAGSLVVVLAWLYYSAQLFFLGAEFTKVYRRTVGSGHTAIQGAQQA